MSPVTASTETNLPGAPTSTAALPHAQHRLAKSTSRRTTFGSLRFIAMVISVVALLAWGIRAGIHAYRYVETEDAFVVGHLHQISARAEGQVQEVLVRENQTVRAGDVLLRLDPLELQIALQKAEASVAQAQAQLAQSVANASQAVAAVAETRARAAQAEAQLEQAGSQLALAQLTLSRNEQLLASGTAVTQADIDGLRAAFQAAQAARKAAEANVLAVRAAIGSAEAAQVSMGAQTDAARANVAAAEAARRDAQRQLANTTIVAPADGRIGNKHVESGNHVQAGQALLALAEPDTWIVANFKETQLAHLHAGQPVELTIDALPDLALHGTLESLSPASGAPFALLPPDNATGNFNKVVQRVPVKIVLDETSRAQTAGLLRLGLSVIVDIRVR